MNTLTPEKNISFVIPAFNSALTIKETVDSVFDTNFTQGDEVIIVEDHSTDNTLSIIQELSRIYSPNIRIIRNQENKGCPVSRNIGIKEAKNEYIFSLDSDNVLSKNSISALKETLISSNADIATFGEIHFFTDMKQKITHKWIYKKEWFTLEDLFSGNLSPAPVGNYMFTKKAWEKVAGFSELEKGLHEAWIFTFKQLIAGSKIFIDNKGFYYHRYGHESLTIREYKKDNVEKSILQSALANNMDIFEESEKEYISINTPQWIHKLNKRPIKLNSAKKGRNGKLHRTLYGIGCSVLKKLRFK